MNAIPVAKPMRLRRLGVSRRWFVVLMIVVSAIAFGAVALSFGKPDATLIQATSVKDLQKNVPVSNAGGRFFVVKLATGEIIALSSADPGRPYAAKDCPIQWRTDVSFDSRFGWLRGECSGSTFEPNGIKIFGPSSSYMTRYAIEIRNGVVFVDTQRLLPPCTDRDFEGCEANW